MKNKEIRQELKNVGMKQWELAEQLGIAETTLCVKLRKELPEDQKQHILEVIRKAGQQK